MSDKNDLKSAFSPFKIAMVILNLVTFTVNEICTRVLPSCLWQLCGPRHQPEEALVLPSCPWGTKGPGSARCCLQPVLPSGPWNVNDNRTTKTTHKGAHHCSFYRLLNCLKATYSSFEGKVSPPQLSSFYKR